MVNLGVKKKITEEKYLKKIEKKYARKIANESVLNSLNSVSAFSN